MLDTLTFSELEAQEVELLPARTVLSLIRMGVPQGDGSGQGGGINVLSGNTTNGNKSGCDTGLVNVSILECLKL